MSYIHSFIVYCMVATVSGSAFAERPDASSKEDFALTPDWSGKSRILSENAIDNLDISQVTLLTLMSSLMNVSEGELDINVKALYSDLKDDGSIELNAETAKYAILLKSFIPLLCSHNEGILPVNREGKVVSTIELSISHLSELAIDREVNGLSILNDKINYEKDNTVTIASEIMPLLVLSKLVCDSLGKSSLLVSDIDLILNRAGSPTGSVVKLDPNNPSINELSDAVANPFGQSGEELQQAANKADADYKKNGYVEVADHKIIDLEETYLEFKNNYKPLEQVSEKLSFLPSKKLEQQGFEFLGAAEQGSYTDSGYAGVSSLYDSPLGKIVISETDLVTSETTVFVSPESMNTKIGDNAASLTVFKGKQSDRYYSDIFWVDEGASRMYTVEVSVNLNAEDQEQNKELLFDLLNNGFGVTQ